MIIHNLIDFSKITIYDLLKGYGDMIKFSKIFQYISQYLVNNYIVLYIIFYYLDKHYTFK